MIKLDSFHKTLTANKWAIVSPSPISTPPHPLIALKAAQVERFQHLHHPRERRACISKSNRVHRIKTEWSTVSNQVLATTTEL